MLDWLKDNYLYVIIGAVVLIVLVIVIITLVKKPKDKKKSVIDTVLDETQEREIGKNYKNCWLVVKRGLQNYYLYLFDDKSKPIFRSELFSSAVTAKASVEDMIETINNNRYKNMRITDGRVYAKYMDKKGKKSLGITSTFIEFGNENMENHLKITAGTAEIIDKPVKDLTLVEYQPVAVPIPKKFRKDLFTILEPGYEYYLTLKAESGLDLYVSEPYENKNLAKKAEPIQRDVLLNGHYYIDKDENGKFYFIITSNSDETMFISDDFETSKDCMNRIHELRLRLVDDD